MRTGRFYRPAKLSLMSRVEARGELLRTLSLAIDDSGEAGHWFRWPRTH